MLINLLKSIVKRLVDKPDLVIINEVESDGKRIIQVKVAPQDLSRVIGSEGRTFRALRMLVYTLSSEPKDLVVDSIE